MKKILVVILIMMTTLAFADNNEMSTLLYGKIDHGGYGGPVMKVTEMNNKIGVLVGGHGGWIIDHQFIIGGGGYGLSNDVSVNRFNNFDGRNYLNFGYGGLELGYIFASNSLIHLDFITLVGAGGVGYRRSIFDENWDNDYDCDHHHDHNYWDDDCDELEKPVFVLEPTVNLMLNVSKHVRLGVGASYRYVSGLKEMDIDNNELMGASATFNIQFGAF